MALCVDKVGRRARTAGQAAMAQPHPAGDPLTGAEQPAATGDIVVDYV